MWKEISPSIAVGVMVLLAGGWRAPSVGCPFSFDVDTIYSEGLRLGDSTVMLNDGSDSLTIREIVVVRDLDECRDCFIAFDTDPLAPQLYAEAYEVAPDYSYWQDFKRIELPGRRNVVLKYWRLEAILALSRSSSGPADYTGDTTTAMLVFEADGCSDTLYVRGLAEDPSEAKSSGLMSLGRGTEVGIEGGVVWNIAGRRLTPGREPRARSRARQIVVQRDGRRMIARW